MNFLHVVAGISLMCTLKRVGASTYPCGRTFFCTLHELLMSPTWTRNRRCSKSSSTAQQGRTLDSFTNRPLCHIVSYAAVKSMKTSSFPLAFPVIWGRRYGCLLHRPLSVLQSACPSCTHPSTLSLVSLSSFSPVSLSSSLSSLRDLLPSS